MFPFNYCLSESELQVKLGSRVVRRISYCDIESVRAGSAFVNEHWTNIWPLSFVTVRRKTGWFRNFVINPPDRGNFINALRLKAGLESSGLPPE